MGDCSGGVGDDFTWSDMEVVEMSAKKKVEKKVPKWAEGLTKVQRKRVEVCRDVVARIKTKRIKVKHGEYLRWPALLAAHVAKGGEELQEVMKRVTKPCEVCAKGALFISTVDKFDRCKIVPGFNARTESATLQLGGVDCSPGGLWEWENDSLKGTLTTVFSQHQVDLVEEAFEARKFILKEIEEEWGIWGEHVTTKDEKIAATKWGIRYGRGNVRLLAIMRNMIRNKGQFVL